MSEFEEVFNKLEKAGLLELQDGKILCTLKGGSLYFNSLMDIYKQDEQYLTRIYTDKDRKLLKEISENAVARMLVRQFPKIGYKECADLHRLLCHLYPIKKLIDSFMKKEIYYDLTTNVDWLKRNSDLSESRVFSTVGVGIDRSASYVREHYDPI